MLKSSVQNKILKTLPDDRPITAIQIIENLDQCPRNFYPITKTYDQDSDADLGEKSIFKSSSGRYLCFSKSEVTKCIFLGSEIYLPTGSAIGLIWFFRGYYGQQFMCHSSKGNGSVEVGYDFQNPNSRGIPNFVVQEIIVVTEKTNPPKGFSLLNRTADSGQKAWKRKQICYRLANQKEARTAITDIIVCSRLRKAPAEFFLAGEINGTTVFYKMGNAESGQTPPERPPKPLSPNTNNVYPSLGQSDNDYEILRPGPGFSPVGPTRPAPKPPMPPSPAHPSVLHQNSSHTVGNSAYYGLEGVPFVVNSKLSCAGSGDNKGQKIKTKSMHQILNEYEYSFTTERQIQ